MKSPKLPPSSSRSTVVFAVLTATLSSLFTVFTISRMETQDRSELKAMLSGFMPTLTYMTIGIVLIQAALYAALQHVPAEHLGLTTDQHKRLLSFTVRLMLSSLAMVITGVFLQFFFSF